MTTVMTIPLLILITASGLMHLFGHYKNHKLMFYVGKPLTMSLIIVLALQGDKTGFYWLMIGGLLLSLVGDVFLMLPKDRFIQGLVSFLIAHVLYIAAFYLLADFQFNGVIVAIFGCLGLAIYALLFNGLDGLKIPVFFYMVIILIMAIFGTSLWWQLNTPQSLLICLGALSFLVSDLLLAWNRFKHSFYSSTALIMITYFVAQTLLALSVIG